MLCISDYFRHLWNYNENKHHIYFVFRIILDTYGIIMRNKNHIYCVFRIILCSPTCPYAGTTSEPRTVWSLMHWRLYGTQTFVVK